MCDSRPVSIGITECLCRHLGRLGTSAPGPTVVSQAPTLNCVWLNLAPIRMYALPPNGLG